MTIPSHRQNVSFSPSLVLVYRCLTSSLLRELFEYMNWTALLLPKNVFSKDQMGSDSFLPFIGVSPRDTKSENSIGRDPQTRFHHAPTAPNKVYKTWRDCLDFSFSCGASPRFIHGSLAASIVDKFRLWDKRLTDKSF